MSHPFYQTLLNAAKAVYAKENPLKLTDASSSASKMEHKPNDLDALEPFITGGLGNFPYYWQDPMNNLFNRDTYNWINANVKAGAYPIEQDDGSSFTNLSIEALGAVCYTLSTADQAALVADSHKIFNAQSVLLKAWIKAYGSIPPATATQAPIDMIIMIIANTWASPATTFEKMLDAAVLSDLLNKVPPSGTAVLPLLVKYINVINASLSLQNASPSQTGYLKTALEALQFPSLRNGGLKTNSQEILPAYEVTTPLADILEGLKSTSSNFSVHLKITAGAGNEIKIELPDGNDFKMDVDTFFALSATSGENVFKSMLEKNASPIEMELAFSGLTMVYFEPVAFDKTIGKYWLWKEALIGAVRNGEQDVTGFKFAPKPSIDFSKQGPYGYLTAVAISNFPNIYIKLASPPNKSTADWVPGFAEEIKLMGNAMGGDAFPIPLEFQRATKEVEESGTLFLHTARKTNVPSIDSRAWVHGVLVEYPVAGA